MLKPLIRILLLALAFYFILPLIPGITMHGNFGHAIIVGLVFTLMGWIVELVAITLTALFTITTLGLALIVLIPLWLLGFWLIPAFVLKLIADMMPTYLTVSGWGPAILGGLVILVIGIATGGNPKRYVR
jgi:uncharacterized membrane protein YvlD (DUF360 family)